MLATSRIAPVGSVRTQDEGFAALVGIAATDAGFLVCSGAGSAAEAWGGGAITGPGAGAAAVEAAEGEGADGGGATIAGGAVGDDSGGEYGGGDGSRDFPGSAWAVGMEDGMDDGADVDTDVGVDVRVTTMLLASMSCQP